MPTMLTPAEIKLLLANLGLRERTLVLLAASTGLRQSELFALQWSDIDFAQEIMSVTRSIVNAWSVVAKRNLHGSPSRFILRFARHCFSGEESVTIRNPTIGCSRGRPYRERRPYWVQAILRRYIQPIAHSLGIQKKIGWHTFRHTYLDPIAQRRSRVQGDAGTSATFFIAINPRSVHPGNFTGKARRASSGTRIGFFFGNGRHNSSANAGHELV